MTGDIQVVKFVVCLASFIFFYSNYSTKVTMAFEWNCGMLLCQNPFLSPLCVCVCFSKKKNIFFNLLLFSSTYSSLKGHREIEKTKKQKEVVTKRETNRNQKRNEEIEDGRAHRENKEKEVTQRIRREKIEIGEIAHTSSNRSGLRKRGEIILHPREVGT